MPARLAPQQRTSLRPLSACPSTRDGPQCARRAPISQVVARRHCPASFQFGALQTASSSPASVAHSSRAPEWGESRAHDSGCASSARLARSGIADVRPHHLPRGSTKGLLHAIRQLSDFVLPLLCETQVAVHLLSGRRRHGVGAPLGKVSSALCVD